MLALNPYHTVGANQPAGERFQGLRIFAFDFLPDNTALYSRRGWFGNTGEAGDRQMAQLEVIENREQLFVARLDFSADALADSTIFQPRRRGYGRALVCALARSSIHEHECRQPRLFGQRK